ncbi:MAG: dihydroneopterin aldolase [Pseudorhodoplanes sp.]
MKDCIFINGLVIHAHHGVLEHEARVGQRFIIDLELTVDLADAAQSDRLSDTVSYAAIVDTATRVFSARAYRLVEAAAGAVADAIFAAFPRVEALRVTVHKPHAPISAIFADVGVTLHRTRAGHSRA